MARQKETLFKIRVHQQLKELPKTWFFKPGLGTIAGVPDVIGVCNGRFFAWELKTQHGRATMLQLFTLEKIKNCGGIARIVRPYDLWKAMDELRSISEN